MAEGMEGMGRLCPLIKQGATRDRTWKNWGNWGNWGKGILRCGTARQHDLPLRTRENGAHQACCRLHAAGRSRDDDGGCVLFGLFGDALRVLREGAYAFHAGVLQPSLFQDLRPSVGDDAQKFERIVPMRSAVVRHHVGGQRLFGVRLFQREVLLQPFQCTRKRDRRRRGGSVRCAFVGIQPLLDQLGEQQATF